MTEELRKAVVAAYGGESIWRTAKKVKATVWTGGWHLYSNFREDHVAELGSTFPGPGPNFISAREEWSECSKAAT